MADAKTQYDVLSEELKLVQAAIEPKTAAKELRDFMDANKEKEGLAGFPGPNPWMEAARSEGGCCVIS
jgi:hypothetical protein